MSPKADPAGTREYTWNGRTGPFTLLLTPAVFEPSYTSRVLADALEVQPGETVIDVGCGSGVLSFVAARLDAGHVWGTDIEEEAVAVARQNAERLDLASRTEFRAGSLLEPLEGVQADIVIGDVSGIPDEVAEIAGWFPGGHAGGPTGAEMPLAMLEAVGDYLKPGGRMYLPTGTIQDERRILEAARRLFGEANLEEVAEREFPLPALVAKSKAVGRLMTQGLLNLRQKGSRLLWRLAIWRVVRR